jgi:lipopolysaccharide export LptBFGC system permease protein LptF
MQADREVTVFITSGKHPFSLFLPLLTLSICISGVILYLQTTASPRSYGIFRSFQDEIKKNFSATILKPKIFNILGDSIIYFRKRVGRELKDVFISYAPNKGISNTNIITAQSGSYISEGEKIFVLLNNGYRQEIDKSNMIVSTLRFENFSYDVTPFLRRVYAKVRKTSEKTQSELLRDAIQTTNLEERQNYITEYHSRLTATFVPILNALVIAIFMIVAQDRRRAKIRLLISAFGGIFCQILVVTLTNILTKNEYMIIFNYIIIAFFMFFLFVTFMRKRN